MGAGWPRLQDKVLEGFEALRRVAARLGRLNLLNISVLKPGLVSVRRRKLLTIRPDWTNRISANATSKMTSRLWMRACRAPTVGERPCSFNASLGLTLKACSAGARPKAKLVRIEASAVKARTRPSKPISAARGRSVDQDGGAGGVAVEQAIQVSAADGRSQFDPPALVLRERAERRADKDERFPMPPNTPPPVRLDDDIHHPRHQDVRRRDADSRVSQVRVDHVGEPGRRDPPAHLPQERGDAVALIRVGGLQGSVAGTGFSAIIHASVRPSLPRNHSLETK